MNAYTQNYPDPFEFTFTSAGGDSVQFDLDLTDTLAIYPSLTNEVIYRDPLVNEWTSVSLSEAHSVCSIYTYSATVELVTSTSMLEWYNHSEIDTAVVTESPKNEDDIFPVPDYLLADIGADAVGDAEDASGSYLDITYCNASYSDSKLYFRMQNNSGSFPTSSGWNFFGYVVGVLNPDTEDSVAYCLVYAEIPLVLNSGLYRLDLSDSSFTSIGDISTNISDDCLSMSCDISDLVAEDSWQSWPPPSGYIGVSPITLTQSLSDMIINDIGKVAIYIPRSRTTGFLMNSTPTLTDPAATVDESGTVTASVIYTDANDHLAVIRNLHFDTDTYLMTACVKDYDGGTEFSVDITVESTGWYDYYFEFSDGLATVTSDADSIYVEVESYVHGDANGNGDVDIDDVVYLIDYVFAGGPEPVPLESGEVNCIDPIDIDDVVYLIEYLFAGGPPPC